MVNDAPINLPMTSPSWVLWFTSIAAALRFSGRTYAVANLPSASVGTSTFASNGRKSGEAAGHGTGVPVWSDGTVWRTFYDNSQVAA